MKNLTIGTFNADCDYELERIIYKEKADFIVEQIQKNGIEVLAVQHASPLLVSALEKSLFSVDRQICTTKERTNEKRNLDNIVISNSKMKDYTLRCYLPLWPPFKELTKTPIRLQKNIVTVDRIMPTDHEEISLIHVYCDTPYPTLQNKYIEEILLDTCIIQAVQDKDIIIAGTFNLSKEQKDYLRRELQKMNMNLVSLHPDESTPENIVIPNTWELENTTLVSNSFHHKRPLIYTKINKK